MSNESLCPSCGSCGFPMRVPEDFAGGRMGAAYCNTCGDSKGRLKAYEEVLRLNAEYMVREQGLDSTAARSLAQALLAGMPAWKDRRV